MNRLARIIRSLLFAVVFIATGMHVRAQDVRNTSFSAPDGALVLQHRAIIPAPVGEVWKAFTTAAGLTTWGAPYGRIDARLGGLWESSYSREIEPGAPENIRWRYAAIAPMKMLTLQAVNAPPGFKHRELFPRLLMLVEFDESSPGQTQVVLSLLGFDTSPEMKELYTFFESGNAFSMNLLHRRFKDGPIDWETLSQTGTSAH